MRVPRSVMAVGGVVVAAAAIGFTNPRAVHALTAALVQVTNTATNPVVTQASHELAGQIIHLRCESGITGPIPYSNAGWCALWDPSSGEAAAAYVVPANESLVLTSVDISPIEALYGPTCTYAHEDRMVLTKGAVATEGGTQTWILNNLGAHYTYPSGIVLASGASVFTAQDLFVGTPSSCGVGLDTYDLYGYLTAG